MNELTERSSTKAMVLSGDNMQQALNFAQVMAGGLSTLPKHLQGNVSDCMAVTIQAMQWGMNPFAVAQKTHLVSGTLGYEAQLINAVISSSTAIIGRFHYEYGGDWEKQGTNRFVRVGAILKDEEEIQWGEPLYPSKVTTKNSPLWKTAEKQQSAYLALKYWTRIYTPAAILGVYTSDELPDPGQEENDITPPKSAIRRVQNVVEKEPVIEPVIEPEAPTIELTPLDEIGALMLAAVNIESLDAVRHDAQQHDYESNKQQIKDIIEIYKTRKAEMLRAIDKENLNNNK